MFGLFKKDPIKKLEEKYRTKMETALAAQRRGDIDGFSQLSFEADQLAKEIDQLKKTKSSD